MTPHLHNPQQAAQWLKQRVRGTLQTDSRKLAPGDAFIAWPGATTDARTKVRDALDHGAAACLVEEQGVEGAPLLERREREARRERRRWGQRRGGPGLAGGAGGEGCFFFFDGSGSGAGGERRRRRKERGLL